MFLYDSDGERYKLSAYILPLFKLLSNASYDLQVTGELLDDLTSWDALRAALPVGTVSGAPKVFLVTSLFLLLVSFSFYWFIMVLKFKIIKHPNNKKLNPVGFF